MLIAFKGTVVNQTYHSINGGSLRIDSLFKLYFFIFIYSMLLADVYSMLSADIYWMLLADIYSMLLADIYSILSAADIY